MEDAVQNGATDKVGDTMEACMQRAKNQAGEVLAQLIDDGPDASRCVFRSCELRAIKLCALHGIGNAAEQLATITL